MLQSKTILPLQSTIYNQNWVQISIYKITPPPTSDVIPCDVKKVKLEPEEFEDEELKEDKKEFVSSPSP